MASAVRVCQILISVDDGRRTFALRLDMASIYPPPGAMGKIVLGELADKVVEAINKGEDNDKESR